MCFGELIKFGRDSVSLRDFPNLADLEAWYELHNELQLANGNLCDDYAREAQRLAEADGYFLSCCLVNKGRVYETQIFDENFYHIGNMAIVTDHEECYYIDLNWRKLVKLCDFYIGGKY